MESIWKIAVAAIAAALCAAVVKKQVPELGLVLVLCTGGVIFTLSIGAVTQIKDTIDTLVDTAGLSPAVIVPVIKTVAIGLVSRVTAELCRDAKEGGLAVFVEMAGTACALLVCLPLIGTVLSMVTGLL